MSDDKESNVSPNNVKVSLSNEVVIMKFVDPGGRTVLGNSLDSVLVNIREKWWPFLERMAIDVVIV